MKKYLLPLCAATVALFTSAAYAEWDLVADFEQPSDLDKVIDRPNTEGSNARTEIVDGKLAAFPGVALEDTSNLFAGLELGTDLRADSLAVEGPITVYFQLIQPEVPDGQGGTRKAIVDAVFALTHQPPEQWTTVTYNSANAMARINFGDDQGLETRDGGSYVAQENNVLIAGEVYEIWMEVDFFFNEWQGYVRGGQWPERTLLLGTDGNEFLQFRQIPGFEEDGVTPQTVNHFFIALSRGNIEAEKGQDPTFFDNFYIDTSGVNTTAPVEVEEGETWAGYAVTDSGDAYTGDWMGWVHVGFKPWILNYNLDQWMYIDEDAVTEDGGWMYIFNF